MMHEIRRLLQHQTHLLSHFRHVGSSSMLCNIQWLKLHLIKAPKTPWRKVVICRLEIHGMAGQNANVSELWDHTERERGFCFGTWPEAWAATHQQFFVKGEHQCKHTKKQRKQRTALHWKMKSFWSLTKLTRGKCEFALNFCEILPCFPFLNFKFFRGKVMLCCLIGIGVRGVLGIYCFRLI